MSNRQQNPDNAIHSSFWQEIPEGDNPFSAAICRCGGYDVYGDLLDKVTWAENLFLLFHGELPSPRQTQCLNGLAVALANPGPRDYSVQAAMAAGAGGSTAASCLMAALAVGAGNFAGAREVYQAITFWEQCKRDLPQWRLHLRKWEDTRATDTDMTDIWPAMEHPPGFAPYGKSCSTPVRQTLDYLAQIQTEGNLYWLQQHRRALEALTRQPLALSGVAAAALTDLGFSSQQGELLYLLLRLPGAAAHSIEQHWRGSRDFPFYREGIRLTNDPGPPAEPQADTP